LLIAISLPVSKFLHPLKFCLSFAEIPGFEVFKLIASTRN